MGLFNLFKKDKKDAREIENQHSNLEDFSSFTKVTDYIYQTSGITELDKRALSTSRLQQHAISKGIFKTSEVLDKMKSDNDFYQEMINIATVNETFFFREKKELEWLVNYIKQSDRELKILSLPSSSGEEAYSILLMMLENDIDINKVDIVGYDINSEMVQKAKNALYDMHSLHKLESKTVKNHFDIIDDKFYEISHLLKKRVHFFVKNIFDLRDEKEIYDVVICRNLFIYFDDEKRKEATDIIISLLKSDGIYIKGHADHIQSRDDLKKVGYGIYKKV
jgi:chemotaxis protein methyltransferase CheR